MLISFPLNAYNQNPPNTHANMGVYMEFHSKDDHTSTIFGHFCRFTFGLKYHNRNSRVLIWDPPKCAKLNSSQPSYHH